jgi:aryl-alcohol dehydrogenase-like predicted oxidoreductase
MQYRNLGRTGIKVSPYGLGALMFATGSAPVQQHEMRRF